MPSASKHSINSGKSRNGHRAMQATEVPLNQWGRPQKGTKSRIRYDAMLARQVEQATKKALESRTPKVKLILSPECRDGNHHACDISWQTCDCSVCHEGDK